MTTLIKPLFKIKLNTNKIFMEKDNDDSNYNELALRYKKQKQISENIKSSDDKPKNNYDYFKIKNIIKTNLEEKNFNNKYNEFLREEDVIETIKPIEETPVIIGNKTGIEEINKMELQVMEKTKEIEKQIMEINRKRMEFVLGEFKTKLVDLGMKDKNNFIENIDLEFKRTVNQLEEERKVRINGILSLQEKVNETISFCKKVNEELKTKKIELNSDFDCYVNYLTNEKSNAIKTYGTDMEKYIDKRVKVFKSHLENQFK